MTMAERENSFPFVLLPFLFSPQTRGGRVVERASERMPSNTSPAHEESRNLFLLSRAHVGPLLFLFYESRRDGDGTRRDATAKADGPRGVYNRGGGRKGVYNGSGSETRGRKAERKSRGCNGEIMEQGRTTRAVARRYRQGKKAHEGREK